MESQRKTQEKNTFNGNHWPLPWYSPYLGIFVSAFEEASSAKLKKTTSESKRFHCQPSLTDVRSDLILICYVYKNIYHISYIVYIYFFCRGVRWVCPNIQQRVLLPKKRWKWPLTSKGCHVARSRYGCSTVVRASAGLMGNIWYQGICPSRRRWWYFAGSAIRWSQIVVWPTASCSTKGLYCIRIVVIYIYTYLESRWRLHTMFYARGIWLKMFDAVPLLAYLNFEP